MRWLGSESTAPVQANPAASGNASEGARRRPRRVSAATLVLTPFLLYVGVPIVAVVLYSFAGRWAGTVLPAEVTLRYWTSAFSDPGILRAFFTSLTLGVCTTVLVLALAVPAVYWARVRNPRITPILDLSAAIPFALPFVVIGFALLQFSGVVLPWLQGTYALLVLAYVSISFPFAYWALDAAMAAANVRLLTEAAEACGSSTFQTIRRVVLPSIKPGLATAAMLAFAVALGEFALVKVLAGSITTLSLWSAGQMRTAAGAFGSLAVVTTLVFVMLFAISAAVAYLNRSRLGQVVPGTAEGAGAGQS